MRVFYIVIIVLLMVVNAVFHLDKEEHFNAVARTDKPDAMCIATGSINLNTATEAELVSVKGIGYKTAQRIINRRSELGGFKAVEDLLSVEDIGRGKFEDFKEYFYVEQEHN